METRAIAANTRVLAVDARVLAAGEAGMLLGQGSRGVGWRGHCEVMKEGRMEGRKGREGKRRGG